MRKAANHPSKHASLPIDRNPEDWGKVSHHYLYYIATNPYPYFNPYPNPNSNPNRCPIPYPKQYPKLYPKPYPNPKINLYPIPKFCRNIVRIFTGNTGARLSNY